MLRHGSAQQMLSRFAEQLCNERLVEDRSLKPIYQRLQNKSLKITLRRPHVAWWFNFGAQAIQLTCLDPAIQPDCEVLLTFDSLLKLKDPQQLMQLLQNNAIEIQGDPKVIQSFAMLIELAHWDLADCLTPYLGDIASHFIVTQTQRLASRITERHTQLERNINLALSEEWQLAVNPLMAADLYDNIEQLLTRLSQLDRKISTLEHL